MAAATSQVAAISPRVTPASPLPPSALPSPSLPPAQQPPAAPRAPHPLGASHPYPPPAEQPPPPTSSPLRAPPPAPAPPASPFSIAVPPFASSATTLAISLAVVDNPAGETFSVRASLHWSGQGGVERSVEVGRIIPPPPAADEPAAAIGTFLLPISSAARELLRQRDGQTRLRLTVRPVAPASPLPSALHVKILPPRWH